MKISIVTITFNAEQFLRETMQSVLKQTHTDIEYLIIDGKSTDGTVEIIKSFEAEMKEKSIEFRWISEPDKGLYDAMNKGLRMATGDFVWFVNAGDQIFDSTTAQKVSDAIAANELADVVYGQTLIIDQNGTPCGERHKIAPKNLQFKSLLNGLVVCHQSILVRRSIAPNYNLQYRYSADYDWVCGVLEQSRCNVYVDGYLSKFMLSGISAKNRKASWVERYKIMRCHFGLIRTLAAHFVIVLKYPFSRQLG
jgi:glycosyltransferase involved in cell wall biosynthesis